MSPSAGTLVQMVLTIAAGHTDVAGGTRTHVVGERVRQWRRWRKGTGEQVRWRPHGGSRRTQDVWLCRRVKTSDSFWLIGMRDAFSTRVILTNTQSQTPLLLTESDTARSRTQAG
jgi:hypothetical protein